MPKTPIKPAFSASDLCRFLHPIQLVAIVNWFMTNVFRFVGSTFRYVASTFAYVASTFAYVAATF